MAEEETVAEETAPEVAEETGQEAKTERAGV